jgi:CBS domain-containing membrane protein
MLKWFKHVQRFIGLDFETVSSAEKLASSVGGLVGIFSIAYISYQITGAQGAALIVPSMGASAVLVFAVPHGRLSQPWALLGGNLISACIGVTCYKLVPDTFLAAGLAVGLAIGAMHMLNCIHPPGGASALAAVIGGPLIHKLGYSYVLAPILLNASIIFIIAVVYNSAFPWRRYPVGMMRFSDAGTPGIGKPARFIDKHFIEQALSDMDLVVDLTSDDLQRLFTLTLQHADKQLLIPQQIRLGHYYTNGQHGTAWSVRHIIDEASSDDPLKDMVIYRVVEGHGIRSADSCTRSEFANWAAREVFPNHPTKSG